MSVWITYKSNFVVVRVLLAVWFAPAIAIKSISWNTWLALHFKAQHFPPFQFINESFHSKRDLSLRPHDLNRSDRNTTWYRRREDYSRHLILLSSCTSERERPMSLYDLKAGEKECEGNCTHIRDFFCQSIPIIVFSKMYNVSWRNIFIVFFHANFTRGEKKREREKENLHLFCIIYINSPFIVSIMKIFI